MVLMIGQKITTGQVKRTFQLQNTKIRLDPAEMLNQIDSNLISVKNFLQIVKSLLISVCFFNRRTSWMHFWKRE